MTGPSTHLEVRCPDGGPTTLARAWPRAAWRQTQHARRWDEPSPPPREGLDPSPASSWGSGDGLLAALSGVFVLAWRSARCPGRRRRGIRLVRRGGCSHARLGSCPGGEALRRATWPEARGRVPPCRRRSLAHPGRSRPCPAGPAQEPDHRARSDPRGTFAHRVAPAVSAHRERVSRAWLRYLGIGDLDGWGRGETKRAVRQGEKRRGPGWIRPRRARGGRQAPRKASLGQCPDPEPVGGPIDFAGTAISRRAAGRRRGDPWPQVPDWVPSGYTMDTLPGVPPARR